MNDSSRYVIQDKTIIFNPEYNEIFDTSILEILSNLNTIIFNNYKDNKNCGSEFNQLVDNLPNSIISLTFGNCFNQLVDNLPGSIVSLTFGYYFNQLLNNLPNSIVSLTFGNHFDKPVDNLPNSITSLTFGCFLINQWTIYLIPPNTINVINWSKLC